jgi:protein-disulfide isomerase
MLQRQRQDACAATRRLMRLELQVLRREAPFPALRLTASPPARLPPLPQHAASFPALHAPEQTIFLKDTVPAHRAAYCAHAQGKFWEYVGEISHNKKFASNTNLESAASDLKLNTLSWKNCFNNPTTEQKIQNSRILAKQLGITVTPVIFVNNKRLTLTKDIDLRQLLEAFIAP